MGGGAQSKSQKAQDYLDNIEEYPFHEGRPSFIITQPHPAEALANADLNQSSVQKTKKPVINGPRHDPLSRDTTHFLLSRLFRLSCIHCE